MDGPCNPTFYISGLKREWLSRSLAWIENIVVVCEKLILLAAIWRLCENYTETMGHMEAKDKVESRSFNNDTFSGESPLQASQVIHANMQPGLGEEPTI